MTDTRTRARDRARKAREELSEGYVRGLLSRGAHTKPDQWPAILVDTKRAELRLKRALRDIEKGKGKKAAVIDGTKHDTKTRRKAGKLADHPAMKELSRMIEAGEVDRDRTLAYLSSRPKATRKTD